LASTFDMSQTSSLAAVIVIGSKAGDRSGLFAADAGDRCSRADAVHAGDQIEPVGEIAMLANGGDQLLEFALQQSLEPIDLLLPECADTRVAAGLSAGLELGDILGELLDHRQTLGQRRQTRIWRFVGVRGCGRAAGDQDRIDVVVLGMLQHELGVGAHLHRLEDNDNKAVRPQERNHRLLITPHLLRSQCARPCAGATRPTSTDSPRGYCRLAADPRFRRSPRPACTCRYRSRRTRCYACSSSSTLPCDANPRFLQPSGSDEEPIAILLSSSPCGSGAYDPTTGDLLRVRARSRSFLSERPHNTDSR